MTVGESLILSDGPDAMVALNEVGDFIWKQLEVPRTQEEIVVLLTGAFSVDARTARTDVRAFLGELLAKRLIVPMTESPDTTVTAVPPSRSAVLLSEACKRHMTGDWQEALALCLEARQGAEYPEIVELDILICRYHLGAVPEVAAQALSLAPSVPILARIACWGLAMASTYRAGDLRATKGIACELARRVPNPWDLPTVPTFVLRMGERVVVAESSRVDSMLEMIHSVQIQIENTEGEAALLNVLVQGYRERRPA